MLILRVPKFLTDSRGIDFSSLGFSFEFAWVFHSQNHTVCKSYNNEVCQKIFTYAYANVKKWIFLDCFPGNWLRLERFWKLHNLSYSASLHSLSSKILKIREFNLIIFIVLNGPDDVLSTRRTRSLSYVDFNSLSKSIA